MLRDLSDCSIDSAVCDPPYELTANKRGGTGEASVNLNTPQGRARIITGFMGKAWDGSGVPFQPETWVEVLRVLKPGGHLLAFGGSRTYHRLACAIEDAGFEIRDQIQWIYGSGFPKSLDISKAIDAAAGAERAVTGTYLHPDRGTPHGNFRTDNNRVAIGDFSMCEDSRAISVPATDAAKQWSGFGTALKPAHEPIVLARKPLIGTVAENVLKHGTGGLNIDGCRVPTAAADAVAMQRCNTEGSGRFRAGRAEPGAIGRSNPGEVLDTSLGRWPANIILDGSDEVLAGFPETQPSSKLNCTQGARDNHSKGAERLRLRVEEGYLDSGSAARFFYCAKASQDDRNEGLEDLPLRSAGEVTDRKDGSAGLKSPRAGAGRNSGSRNPHPTVKPTDLMRYLCRLVTPPGGTVLDPFCGSGSTGKAAMLEGLKFIGIELSAEYCELAQRRIEAVTRQGLLFASA